MSSSSSMFDFDEFYSCPLRNYQQPWYDYYQTMGHPLIYYAEVQPSSRRSRSGVRKDPNFFVKAFRWYTQEHRPPLQDRDREKPVTNPDLSGFADWLDAKYGLYIQEGHREQINQLAVPEQRIPKKLLATMKSHFTGRHKIKQDVARQKRSCNSCEYIMKPKDVSLTGSDCRRSIIKAVYSDTQEKKSAMKSVSMNSYSRYDMDFRKSIEIMVTEGDINDKPEENCSCAKTEVLTIYESKPNNVNNVGVGSLPCDPSNVDNECECKIPATVHANTQYDKNMDIPISSVTQATPVPSKNRVEKQDKIKNKASNINQSVTSISKKTSNTRKTPKTSDISCLCSLERVPTILPTKSTKKSGSECQDSLQHVDKAVSQKDKIKNKASNKNQSVTSISKKTSNTRKTPKTSDISCLCSLERVPTIQPTKSTKKSESECPDSFQHVDKTVSQKSVETEPIGVCYCTTPTTLPAPPARPVVPPAPVVTPATTGCLCSIRVNESMQTSDTSIRLDDEVIKYPFFMKIVRADKLITDC